MGVFYYSSDYNYRYGPPTRTEYRLVVENLSSRISWQVRSDRDVLGPSSSHHLPSTQGPGRFTLLEGSAGHREADGTMALWWHHITHGARKLNDCSKRFWRLAQNWLVMTPDPQFKQRWKKDQILRKRTKYGTKLSTRRTQRRTSHITPVYGPQLTRELHTYLLY